MKNKHITCKNCTNRNTIKCALYYATTYQDGETTHYFCGSMSQDNFYCAKATDTISCFHCGEKVDNKTNKCSKCGIMYSKIGEENGKTEL